MQVQVTGIRNGTHCEFWLTTAGGHASRLGAWTVKGGETHLVHGLVDHAP